MTKKELVVKWGIKIVFMFISILIWSTVLIGDKRVSYPEWAKTQSILPNYVLCLIGLLGVAALCFIRKRRLIRISIIQEFISSHFHFLLWCMSGILLVVQIFISYHLYFIAGWDVSIVTGAADWIWTGTQGIEDFYYFSMYPNNIAIVYFFALISKAAVILGWEVYRYFVLVVVDCILINLSGVFVSLAMKRLSDDNGAGLQVFFLFALLVGVNPWMVVPYTDTYSILFPSFTFYLYLCAKNESRVLVKCLKWFLLGFVGIVGYLIKPSAAIVLIAVVSYELIRLVVVKEYWQKAITHLLLVVLAYLVSQGLWSHMLDYTGSDLDENLHFSYAHYLMMGLNEENVGAYKAEDVSFSVNFPNQNMREQGNFQEIRKRLEGYGVSGYFKFLLNKLLLNYNDGVFAWEQEGGFEMSPSRNPVTLTGSRIQRLFRCGTDWFPYYATFSQGIWVFLLTMLPFAGISVKGKVMFGDEKNIVWISLIGSFLFLMLFEARARYLYNMLPIYILCAVMGYRNLRWSMK